uniref:Uncharacterized protein n=1 Tax=Oryza punctata TaxID=4537 RepID=A0A0E0JYC6_ORYPU
MALVVGTGKRTRDSGTRGSAVGRRMTPEGESGGGGRQVAAGPEEEGGEGWGFGQRRVGGGSPDNARWDLQKKRREEERNGGGGSPDDVRWDLGKKRRTGGMRRRRSRGGEEGWWSRG